MTRAGLSAAIVAASMGFLVAAASGQDRETENTMKAGPNASRPPARIGDVAWLEGRWIGTGLGGTTETVWSAPLGDSMMGMFRLIKNGKVVFSELMFIVEEKGSLILRLKHFDRALKGWEEKDVAQSFPLVRLGPSSIYFDTITMRKSDDGSLLEYVAIHKKSGEIKEEGFRYQPAKTK
jgi:hypothetical protein